MRELNENEQNLVSGGDSGGIFWGQPAPNPLPPGVAPPGTPRPIVPVMPGIDVPG
jgi:hypothetical protein